MLKSLSTAINSSISVDLYGIYLDTTTRIALDQGGLLTHEASTFSSILYRY